MMKVHYLCEHCGTDIETIEVSHLDEKKLGFDILTEEERRQLLSYDAENDILHVKSMCDTCIEGLNINGTEETDLKADTYENHANKEDNDSEGEGYTDMVEVACPICHEEVTFEARILDEDDPVKVTCPHCGGVVYDNTL